MNIEVGTPVKTENGMYGILVLKGKKTSWIESPYHGKLEFINEIISVDVKALRRLNEKVIEKSEQVLCTCGHQRVDHLFIPFSDGKACRCEADNFTCSCNSFIAADNRHPKEIEAAVKKIESSDKEDLFLQAAREFGADCLFVHDYIKRVMQHHHLNARDKNLQNAFIRLALAVKRRNYPK